MCSAYGIILKGIVVAAIITLGIILKLITSARFSRVERQLKCYSRSTGRVFILSRAYFTGLALSRDGRCSGRAMNAPQRTEASGILLTIPPKAGALEVAMAEG